MMGTQKGGKGEQKQPQKEILVSVLQPIQDCGQFVETITKINGQTFTKTYKKQELLGKGGFANCYKTQQIQSNMIAATKIIDKSNLENFRTKLRLTNEIKLHKTLRHENIVKFYNHFQDDKNVYINLELCQNGALVDIIKNRFTFTTPEVQSVMYGLCEGVKYLHESKIIHRDLKLGNIFLNEKNIVKIGDFGLAVKTQFQKQYKRTVCGTPNYLAPEVLHGRGYYFEVDIWAIGIILYTLFFTFPPFQTEEARTTYQLIKKCEFSFPKFHMAPPQALDLIRKILVANPADRPTIDQILNSPFMKLGQSICYGLPPVITHRAPSKREISNWPKILINQPKIQQQKSIFGFNLRTNSHKKKSKIISPNVSFSGTQKFQEKVEMQVHIRYLEEISEDVLFYALSNGNYGLFQNLTGKNYFKNIFKGQEKKLCVLNNWESFSQNSEMMPESESPYRVLLNVKAKQLKNLNLFIHRESQTESVNISKIKTSKSYYLVRLSNRSLQIIFPQKDSFVLQANRKTIRYFANLQDQTHLLILQASDLNLEQKQNNLPLNLQLNLNKLKKGHKITKNKIEYLKGLVKEAKTPLQKAKRKQSLGETTKTSDLNFKM